jgi:hypothetical protein
MTSPPYGTARERSLPPEAPDVRLEVDPLELWSSMPWREHADCVRGTRALGTGSNPAKCIVMYTLRD